MAIITRITEKGIVQEFQENAQAELKIEVTATDSSGATITGGGGGGGGDVNAQYLTLATSAVLNNERVFTPQSGLIATDAGGLYRLNINNSVVATISGSTFTGTTKHNAGLSGSLTQLTNGESYLIAGNSISISSASNGSITISTTEGLSGSLTKLFDGTSYLVAGPNISIVTQSNGSILITGSAGGGGTPGGNTDEVQFNSAGTFQGNTNFTYNPGSSTLRISGSFAQGNGGTIRGSYSTAIGESVAGARWFYSYSGISAGTITLESSYGDVTSYFTVGNGIHIKESTYYNGLISLDTITNVTFNGSQTIIETSSSRTSADTVSVYDDLMPDSPDGTPTTNSYAEGASTCVDSNAHSEGAGTALGEISHAEGGSKSVGQYSHAEGINSYSIGLASHAEGGASVAIGDYSHAGGAYTIASGSNQQAIGKYNKRNNDFSLFVVGNGTDDDDADRSDIFRVDQSSVQVSGSLIVSGAYILNVVSGTTAPAYTVNAWDHVIVFSANDVTATLPSSSPIGRKIIFKDGTGAASTSGGQMLSCSFGAIDGSATYTMASVDYTAVSVIKINDPDEWIVV